ncbi:MAG TPA: phytanoyl-CoA dioxygenase family protein [Acidobacteriaceae bacterium]|nr:phytanoyl-CoA dioxygenase family protein [Acidobacteriaceae bacterium]
MCSLDLDGFAMIEGVLAAGEVDALIAATDHDGQTETRRGGIRNLLDVPEVQNLASSYKVRSLVEEILGSEARVVRGILFDKTEGANWKVPWHQDVTIAVRDRTDTDGFGPWSIKAGVVHVQPPSSVMERMVSLRFHLDDCPEQNGALRVIVGSHANGKLGELEVQASARNADAVVCAMKRGGLLIMRPLLIHASSASNVPGHRRVIHLDFAAVTLPDGMEWVTNQA